MFSDKVGVEAPIEIFKSEVALVAAIELVEQIAGAEVGVLAELVAEVDQAGVAGEYCLQKLEEAVILFLLRSVALFR